MDQLTISDICKELENSIRNLNYAFNCGQSPTFKTINESFVINKIKSLSNNICNYKNIKIESIDPSLIEISDNENLIIEINQIIDCINRIIKTIRDNICSEISKVLQNNIFNPQLNFTTTIYRQYSIEEIIKFNIGLHMNNSDPDIYNQDIYKNNILPEYKAAVQLLIEISSQTKSNLNNISDSVLIKFNPIIAETTLFTNLKNITNKYNSVELCIQSCFFDISPKLLSIIQQICSKSVSSCSGGEASNSNIIETLAKYSEYDKISKLLFESVLELCNLIKEIDYTTELINNSNDIYNLIQFLHVLAVCVYNFSIKEIYNDKFFTYCKTIHNDTYIINNAFNSKTLKIICKQNFINNIKNDFIKLHFQRILSLIDDNKILYLKFTDIKNYITIISLIFGTYNQYLKQ